MPLKITVHLNLSPTISPLSSFKITNLKYPLHIKDFVSPRKLLTIEISSIFITKNKLASACQ